MPPMGQAVKQGLRASRTSRSLRRFMLAIAVATAAPPGQAAADLIESAWDSVGRFDTTSTLAPGKFVEVCGLLAKGQSVAWSFNAETAMDFNIHYHQGKQILFPKKLYDAMDSAGKLDVAVDKDHCWMWTNKGPSASSLRLRMALRPDWSGSPTPRL